LVLRGIGGAASERLADGLGRRPYKSEKPKSLDALVGRTEWHPLNWRIKDMHRDITDHDRHIRNTGRGCTRTVCSISNRISARWGRAHRIV
jgi:hypothetical protein